MAKAKESKRPDVPMVIWVPVVAAIVTGMFGLGIAKINSGDDKSGGSPPPTTTTASNLHIIKWGTQPLSPPPRLKYVFSGEGATGQDDVYIFGKYVIKAQLGTELRKEVSPPGAVHADGTWRVEWAFPEVPAATDFTVFSVPPSSDLNECPVTLPCTPPSSGQTSSFLPDGLTVEKLLGANTLDRRLIGDTEHIGIAAVPLP